MKHEMDKGPAKTWGTFLKSVFQNVMNTLKWKTGSATLVQIEMPEFVPVPTQQDRPLTEQERSLVRWLLEHGNPDAAEFLPQLADAWVVSRCGCGCASIDFPEAMRGCTSCQTTNGRTTVHIAEYSCSPAVDNSLALKCGLSMGRYPPLRFRALINCGHSK